MHWPLLAFVSLAIGCYQIGAMSIWISVLSIVLKIVLVLAMVAVIGVVVLILRRRFKGATDQ